MSPSVSPQAQRLLLLGVVLLGNLGLYLHLSARLGRLEQMIATVPGNHIGSRGLNDGTGSLNGLPVAGMPIQPKSPISEFGRSAKDLISRMQEYKARTAAIPTATLAADLDGQIAREPSLPAIEQRQYQWLNGALHRMSADAPQAEDLQTTCRGRRCVVTAYFNDDSDAREWASSYLLAGGGEVLKRARIVTQPVAGSDEIVTLQLYLD